MKNKSQKSELDRLIEAVYEGSRIKPDIVPVGWHTPAQIAEKKNISVWTAKRLCQLAVKNGKAEEKTFRVQDDHQHIQRIKHYKVI